MGSMFRLVSLLGACAVMGACSTNHSTVASSAPAPPVAAAPKVNRVYLEDKTLTNPEVKALFEQGYKPVSRNGEVYYCRREQQMGTRFEHMTCRTADQMKQAARESKEFTAEKQRPSGCAALAAGC